MKKFQDFVNDCYLESRPALLMRKLDILLGRFSPIHIVEIKPSTKGRETTITYTPVPNSARSQEADRTFMEELVSKFGFDFKVYPRITSWNELRIHSDRVNKELWLHLKRRFIKPIDVDAKMHALDARYSDLKERIRRKSQVVLEDMVTTAALGAFDPRASFGIEEKASSKEECKSIARRFYGDLKSAGFDLGLKANGKLLKMPFYHNGVCLAHISDLNYDSHLRS